ncbi:MAG: CRTAC1 family protein [Planctomycetes bacterium]|nr:CRTAC1 family protein [Planctomycetota bacterium]
MHVARSGALATLLALSTAPAQSPSLVLTDVTRAVGIDWVQIDNNTMMGAGAAFLDFDGDGWLDVLLAGGDSTPGLYRNLGGGASFAAVTPSPFAPSRGEGYMCVTVGDIDGDGDPDVFFGRFGPNLLYRNDGGGAFTDITTPELAGGPFTFTTTAAFGDFDRDGALDLYVGNYIAPGSVGPYHTPTPNVLLRGRGDGTFTDVTDAVVAGAGTALASTWSDFDADGDVDIVLANDFGAFVEPNRLYRNDGPGTAGWTFTECSAALGTDLRIYCMGIAPGDYDRDGDLDYYFTNLGRNAFLRNDGTSFTDVTTPTGTDVTWDPDTSPRLLATSWGCGLHDFDDDGWLDLYVSNGHIPSDPALANGLRTRNVLFRHDGPSLSYTEVDIRLDDGIGRGVAFGDYDRDGDVDALQCSVSGPPALLRNDSPRRGTWFEARLRGRSSNRDAIGARADLDAGGFIAVREVRRNDSFESSSSPWLHFGLGAATAVRGLAVRWPSGIEQRLHDLPIAVSADITEPLATFERAELRSVPLRIGRLRLGTLLVLDGRLRNRTADVAMLAVEPQLRAGYTPAHPPGIAGSTLWTGRTRDVRLGPAQTRSVTQVLFVPPWHVLPGSLDLDFVWVAADAGRGVDEAKLPLR